LLDACGIAGTEFCPAIGPAASAMASAGICINPSTARSNAKSGLSRGAEVTQH